MKKKLFEDDRRSSERQGESDRRTFLRPTRKLRLLGVLAALVVMGLVVGVVYFFNMK